MTKNTKQLIQAYYDCFNKRDMDGFFALLDQEVVHDINQGNTQYGLAVFQKFMERMNRCYQETIENLVIMINDDGSRAACEFLVEGTYLATDEGLPPAEKQHYALPGGAFFEIKNSKITRVTNYYNMNDWIKQVKN